MARDLKSRRRRALAATFANVLDEDTLLQELWLLQDSLRSDAVGDIIELVDGVARRHMLDPGTCKRLYTELFKALRQPEEALPLDPWPAMQAARAAAEPPRMAYPPAMPMGMPPAGGAAGWPPADPYAAAPGMAMQPPPGYPGMPPGAYPGMPMPPGYPGAAYPGAAPMLPPGYAQPGAAMPAAAPAAAPVPVPVPVPVPAPVAADDPAAPVVPMDPFARTGLPTEPVGAAPAAAAEALEPEPPVVFAALMRAVIAEVQRFHREALDEIRSDAIRLLAGSAAPPALREAFARAWERPLAAEWALPGRVDDLADLVKLVHRALEMSFGRAGADQIVQRGVSTAGALPEAQRLSPMRLLASM